MSLLIIYLSFIIKQPKISNHPWLTEHFNSKINYLSGMFMGIYLEKNKISLPVFILPGVADSNFLRLALTKLMAERIAFFLTIFLSAIIIDSSSVRRLSKLTCASESSIFMTASPRIISVSFSSSLYITATY